MKANTRLDLELRLRIHGAIHPLRNMLYVVHRRNFFLPIFCNAMLALKNTQIRLYYGTCGPRLLHGWRADEGLRHMRTTTAPWRSENWHTDVRKAPPLPGKCMIMHQTTHTTGLHWTSVTRTGQRNKKLYLVKKCPNFPHRFQTVDKSR